MIGIPALAELGCGPAHGLGCKHWSWSCLYGRGTAVSLPTVAPTLAGPVHFGLGPIRVGPGPAYCGLGHVYLALASSTLALPGGGSEPSTFPRQIPGVACQVPCRPRPSMCPMLCCVRVRVRIHVRVRVREPQFGQCCVRTMFDHELFGHCCVRAVFGERSVLFEGSFS